MVRSRAWLIALVALVVGFIAPVRTASAAGPYYPPDPPPVYVDAGVKQLGTFPVPGLYMGPTSPGLPPTPYVEFELTVDPALPALSDPVMAVPSVNGEADAHFAVGIIDHKGLDGFHPFVGIAMFQVQACGYDTSTTYPYLLIGCHTFNLVLYVGVPLPEVEEPAPTGVATDVLLPVSAAVALLGGALVVLARPRRRRLAHVRGHSLR